MSSRPALAFLPCFVAALLLVKVTVVHADECQPQCHPGRGICVGGQCLCQSPWGGDDCGLDVSGASAPAVRQNKAPLFTEAADSTEASDEEEPSEQPLVAGSHELLATPPLALASALLEVPQEAPAEGVQVADTDKPSLPVVEVPQEVPAEGVADTDRPSLPVVEAHAQMDVAANSPGALESLESSANMQVKESVQPVVVHAIRRRSQGQAAPHQKSSRMNVYEGSPHRPSSQQRSQPLFNQIALSRAMPEDDMPPVYSVVRIADPQPHPQEERMRLQQAAVARISDDDAANRHSSFSIHDRESQEVIRKRPEKESPPVTAVKQSTRLRVSRSSLRKELDELNEDANRLKMQGDPLSNAVLQDLAPLDRDLRLVGGQGRLSLSLETISTTTCIAVPAYAQAGVIALWLLFAGFDYFMRNVIKTERHGEGMGCCICVNISRWTMSIHWYTIVGVLLWVLVLNSSWAYMCYSGAAQELLSVIAAYAFTALAIVGGVFILIMQLYFRYVHENVQKMQRLETSVTDLVGLLSVKYGKQLKQAQEKTKEHVAKVGDVTDDFTDFLGITEASSEEDVSCWNGCKAAGPGAKKKKAKDPMSRA